MLWSMRTVTLDPKQQRYADILSRLDAGAMTTSQAAPLMNKSPRQVRRLLSRYRTDGMSCLVHGNTGRSPTNKTADHVLSTLTTLCGRDGPYSDLNTCHLAEILSERHDLPFPRSTLDRLLVQAGLKRRKRRPKPVTRVRRERCPALGQMLQIDGSPHDWLEGRGPRMCLVGAIDDATGAVLYGRFSPTEDQRSYLRLLRAIAVEHGIPQAIYHDRHSILRSPKEATLEEQLQGQKPRSQVQRVMEELGIEAIPAGSPQAKGRVERLWKTLQDRLTKELRLAGITTLEQANAFLPEFLARYNARFSQEPRDKEAAFVPLGRDADLVRLFSTRESRVVQNDHTLSFCGHVLQLHKAALATSLAQKKVDVHVTPEGEVAVYFEKKKLSFCSLDPAIHKGARAQASAAKPEAGDALRILNPASEKNKPTVSPWMDGFEVFHHGPSPEKDLAIYNKLSSSGGHFP